MLEPKVKKDGAGRRITILGLILMLLVGAVSLAGILLDDGGRPAVFVTARGAETELYGGEGLYRYDGFVKAVAMRGFDWIGLCLGLPLLGLALWFRWRGSPVAPFFLAGLFLHFAYAYLLAALGNAFNVLFLPWTAIYSVSLFGLFSQVREVFAGEMPEAFRARFPRRSLAAAFFIFGGFFPVAYLPSIIGAYLGGQPPAELGVYTTLELPSLELAIMAPLFFIAAAGLIAKKLYGYLLAAALSVASVPMFLSLHVGVMLGVWQYQRSFSFQFIVIALVFGAFTVAMFRPVRTVPAQDNRMS